MKNTNVMKIIVGMTVVGFFIYCGILIAGSKKTETVTKKPIQNTNIPTGVEVVKLFTVDEVAVHNTLSNCWIIVSQKVYDVTSYIKAHPGGSRTIVNTCGKEATSAYNTRGGTGTHSGNANAMLTDYFIGNIK